MAILVTGGSGFVGLNLVEHLLGRGDEVVSFDLGPPPAAAVERFRQLPGRLRTVTGDITERAAVDTTFSGTAVTGVVHAAVIKPGERREHDAFQRIVSVNVVGAVTVMEAALAAGAPRFVYVSSGAVYGSGARRPSLDEEDPIPAPDTLYGITKLTAERIGVRLAALCGFPFTAVRLGSVFGPWERHSGARDTLSAVRRDWIYSRDVAAGLATILDRASLPEPVYNLSTGREWTVADWCERLARAFPGFAWRIDPHPGGATVDLHGRFDRPPLATERLVRDSGFDARYELEAAFADYMAWIEETGGAELVG